MTGPSRARVLRWGDFFFRWRSYLPLGLLPFAVVAIARYQYPFGSHAADRAWEAWCVLLALGGLALRIWTAGSAAPGTSGRNTREQKAATLNTTGPYSLVRHPLYLANSIIAIALSLFPHAWVAPPLVTMLMAGYYGCIAEREEAYLREKFGSEFVAWAARVPAFWPSFRTYRAAGPFRWKAAARREFYALALILIAPLGLDVVEDLLETGTLDLDGVWTVSAALGVVAFVGLRYLKKRTSFLTVPRGPGGPGEGPAPVPVRR